jgi:hypothetical protein
MAFSTDGGTLAAGSGDGTVSLWDVKCGEMLQRLSQTSPMLSRGVPSASEVVCIAFAPNGKTLASGSRDGKVRVWQLKLGLTQKETKTTRFLKRVHLENATFGTNQPRRVLKDACAFIMNQNSSSGVYVITSKDWHDVNGSAGRSGYKPEQRHLILRAEDGWVRYEDFQLLRLPIGSERPKAWRLADLLVLVHRDGTMTMFRSEDAKLRRQIEDRKIRANEDGSNIEKRVDVPPGEVYSIHNGAYTEISNVTTNVIAQDGDMDARDSYCSSEARARRMADHEAIAHDSDHDCGNHDVDCDVFHDAESILEPAPLA